MVADIEIRWANRRWRFEAVAIDVSAEVDVMARQYVPREIEFTVPIGDTVTEWLMGRAWERIQVEVRVNGEVYSTSPVVSVECLGTTSSGTGMTRITVADRPAESSPCPPLRDITIRTKDVQASADATAAALAAWTIEDAKNGPDVVNGAMEYSFTTPQNAAPGPVNVFALKTQGLTWPIPFGKPGYDSKPAYRAIQVDSSHRRILVAAFPISGTVSIQKGGYDTWYSYTLEPYRVNGRDVAVVAIPTFPGIPADQEYDETSAFYVAFDGTASGLPGDAVSVCQWLLSNTIGVRVDYAAWTGVASRLRFYKFDCCLDQTGDAWQLLTGDVLPLLPIQLVQTPYGIGAKWIDFDPRTATRRVKVLYNVSVEPVVDASLKLDDNQPTTSCSIGYAPNAASGDYAGRVIFNALSSSFAVAQSSQAQGKVKRFDTPWIYDRAVAQLVARDIVTAGCNRFSRIEVDAAPMTHGDEGTNPLHAGDVFDLYDDGRVNAYGMVLSEKRSGNTLRFVLGLVQR